MADSGTGDDFSVEFFGPFLTVDEEFLQALLDTLKTRCPQVTVPLNRLTNARCPILLLVNRVFAVALMYVYQVPRKREQLGPRVHRKEAARLAKRLDSIATDVEVMRARLGAVATREAVADRHLLELPQTLRDASQSLLLLQRQRMKGASGYVEPKTLPMYKWALVEFVRQATGRQFYNEIGTLLASTVSLYKTLPEADRDEFSGEALRKDIERYLVLRDANRRKNPDGDSSN